MGRDGKGNRWKHRHSWPYGRSEVPRNFRERKFIGEPQYKLDEVYISPLRRRRRYAEDGTVSYVEVPRQMEPTGIHVFDAFLQYLSRGESDVKAFTDDYGLRREDLESLVFILTGMRGMDFRIAYHLKAAEELLRFTDLSMAEVARYSGFGSANNLYLTYKREFNTSPGCRRTQLQKAGDRGLYKL